MATVEENSFEIERRIVGFKSTTTLPDDSSLGYNGNPNNVVNGATAGQTLIYNCPIASIYTEDDGKMWRKTTMPNTWVEMGSGSSGTTNKVESFIMTSLILANKTVTLSSVPTNNQSIREFVENIGMKAEVGVDYSYTTNTIHWTGYEFSDKLGVGDTITIYYY